MEQTNWALNPCSWPPLRALEDPPRPSLGRPPRPPTWVQFGKGKRPVFSQGSEERSPGPPRPVSRVGLWPGANSEHVRVLK